MTITERTKTVKSLTKIAAAAVIIAAVIVGISYLGIPINGTSLAFAEVIEKFQKKGYAFTYSVEVQGKITGGARVWCRNQGLYGGP